jgi:hypothetical protein
MPPKIQAVIHEEWQELDTSAEEILQWMKQQRVFHEFAQGRAPFFSHLRGSFTLCHGITAYLNCSVVGTWAILECWDQPKAVCRCGLLHSAYTRQGFYFRYFDILDPKSRDLLATVVGKDAEELVYK